jgi:REP element-mobilizing transposase RayT
MAFVFRAPREFAEVERRRRHLPHWEQTGCTYFLTWRLADSVPESVWRPWVEERKLFLESHPKPWDASVQKAFNTQFTRRMEDWLDAGHGSCALRSPEIRRVGEEALSFFQGQRYELNAWVLMPNHVHVLVQPLLMRDGDEGESGSDTDSLVCSSSGKDAFGAADTEQTGMSVSPYAADTEQTGMSVSPYAADAEQTGMSVAPYDTDTEQTGMSVSPYDTDAEETGMSVSRCYPLSLILKTWKGVSSRKINALLGRKGAFWMDETYDHLVRSEVQLEHFRRYIRENPVKAGLASSDFTLWMGDAEGERERD